MKTILYKSLLIASVFALFSSCSKQDEPVVVPEPTAQEMILGIWRIDRANSDIYFWDFEEGEAMVTFRADSTMVFQNNGVQTIIPAGESLRTYYIENRCLSPYNSCPTEERIDVLVTLTTTVLYNSIYFTDNGSQLSFGMNYVDGIDFQCSKIDDNL